MGSDTPNCNDNNYYVNENNPVSNFYERPNLASNDWIQNSGLDTGGSRQHVCQNNEKNNEQKNSRNYVQTQVNSHNWNFSSNPYRLYNDNPYGIVLSSNSSTQASSFISSASTSSADGNCSLNIQSVQPPHQIKRVFFQGLNVI